MKFRVLYAGDSEVGGPANYLLAVLRQGGFRVTHVPPKHSLKMADVKREWDAVILSDYPAKSCSAQVQVEISRCVGRGAGFLMVGGWASFSAPWGLWQGSILERILPIWCLGKDDRTNFFSGAAVIPKEPHSAFDPKIFRKLPMICGLNRVIAKDSGKVILTSKPIWVRSSAGQLSASFKNKELPLLIMDQNPKMRVAAYTSDFAPHWCGGLVDWGEKRLKLPVAPGIGVEVGDFYAKFIISLVNWLCGGSSSSPDF